MDTLASLLPAPDRSRCSRDGRQLVRRDAAGIAFLFCEHCHGLWIPGDQLEVLALRIAGGAAAPSSRARLQAGTVHEGTVRCLCPRGPLMEHRQASGAALDHCTVCGAVWLDGAELAQVVAHYRGSPRRPSSGLLDGLDLLEPLGPLFEGLLALLDLFGFF